MQLHASTRKIPLEVLMTVLLLSVYVTAASAAGTYLGASFSRAFASQNVSDAATMELEAPSLFAQAPEP
jgi:hypothetical protein